jgi:hypothetical protein
MGVMKKLTALLVILVLVGGCEMFSKRREQQTDLMIRANKLADAQEMFYANAPGPMPRYAASLDELLAFDENLITDSTVVFLFERRPWNHYRVTVKFRDADWSIVCTPDDGCIMIDPRAKK